MSSIPESAIERTDPWRVTLRAWRGDMRADGRVYADHTLWKAIRRDLTLQQVANVACLPGVVGASMAMPDAHQGYGFPIGGVVATDAAGDGVVSPGGVGFDINCGVRLLATELDAGAAGRNLDELVDRIYARVPSGFQKSRRRKIDGKSMTRLLEQGAGWAVGAGFGEPGDLERQEARGALPMADPDAVGDKARERGAGQVGTLGSGNHFVEVQRVDAILDPPAAEAFGLHEGQLVVLIHTGSRGLGHQVCSDQVRVFRRAMRTYGIEIPDPQLACAPVSSPEGQRYLAAMAAAANFAWANRQVITHEVRGALQDAFGRPIRADVVYDVAHNIAKLEQHDVDGEQRLLCVHRKGATRAFPAGHRELPADLRDVGQPVFIPGSMGTASYVLVGTPQAMRETWGSVCHGAGRAMSRTAARKKANAREVKRELARDGIRIRSASKAGIVEEFPGAYKDVANVIDVVEGAGLARAVARLRPLGVVKG